MTELFDLEPMPNTVGEIMGDLPAAGAGPLLPFVPPMLEVTPPVPEPGIYFGMTDEQYFSIPCLSTSGIKKLAASAMMFWADSWMNPKKERVEKSHFFIGHAYHCRLLEGREAFNARYVLAIDRNDYPQAIEKSDEIKDAISKVPLPPELVTEKSQCHKAVTKVEEDDGQGGKRMRPAVKDDLIRQLLGIWPDAPLWDNIEKNYIKQAGGRLQISASLVEEIEIAAKMIENDPEVEPVARGGHAEVVLIWHCPMTGVPMKCKVDKLKVRRMVDLKTFANQHERSIDNAIHQAISNNKLGLQPTVYFEGAREVRKIVRERGAAAVFICPDADGVVDRDKEQDLTNWALKWASHREHDEWTWIFQMKGAAPITRAVDFSAQSATKMIFDEVIRRAKLRFVEFANTFDCDPWLDLAPRRVLADEDLSNYATEI